MHKILGRAYRGALYFVVALETRSTYCNTFLNLQSKAAVNRFGFYEFFAGGGMARLGLGSKWECLIANDNDEKKAASYKTNFPGSDRYLIVRDVSLLTKNDLPSRAILSW